MRKMILLAAMVAITALMLAAAPALAQTGPFRSIDGSSIKPGDCGRFDREPFDGVQLTREEVLAEFDLTDAELREIVGGEGTPFFCVIFGELPPIPPDDGNDDGRDNDGRDNDGRDNNNNNNNAVPVFEISQESEQEAESGDIDQSFTVTGGGDNSNQTVGIQGVANTGNAQNQIGVIDAGNGFGDFDDNNDDERFFFVDDFCDFDSDGDGICDRLDRLEDRFEDRCENGDNDGDGFCDRLEERIEDLEDEIDGGFFFVVDDFDNDDDRFFGNNGSDFEFEDVGASIEVSPTNTVTSDQQVNQAATAFGK